MESFERKVRGFVSALKKLNRTKGKNFRQIGEELGIDKDTAIEIFVRALLKVTRGCRYYGLDVVQTVRELETYRR